MSTCSFSLRSVSDCVQSPSLVPGSCFTSKPQHKHCCGGSHRKEGGSTCQCSCTASLELMMRLHHPGIPGQAWVGIRAEVPFLEIPLFLYHLSFLRIIVRENEAGFEAVNMSSLVTKILRY